MEKLKISEMAKKLNVTRQTVENWTRKGLPYETVRVAGKKPHKVVTYEDVKKFLNLSE
jgi:predicted site-specific integrase-resolvase